MSYLKPWIGLSAALVMVLLPADRRVYGAEGADAPASLPAVSASSFGVTPEFQLANSLSLTNTFAACMANPLVNTIGTALMSGGKGMAGAGCKSVEFKGDTSPSCTLFKVGGKFDPALFGAMQTRMEEAVASIACQKNGLTAVMNEIQCLTTQATALKNQAKALQAAYTQNISKMQQDVAQLKAIEKDRELQLEDVVGHLRGDEKTGSKGLLGVREEHKALMAAIEGEIQGIKERQKDAELQRKAFEEDVSRMTMAKTNECFSSRKVASYHCVPNGPAVTAREYVLCRFEQNQRLGTNGVVEKGSIRAKQAAARQAELATILDSILSQSPTNSGVGKTPEEAAAIVSQPVKLMSPTDIEREFGPQLASFNGKGLDIHSFIIKTLGSCYSDSKKVVDKERNMAATQLGRGQEMLKRMERETDRMYRDNLTKYSNQYSQTMAALTGMHIPAGAAATGSPLVDSRACMNTRKPESQANCLDNIKANLHEIWSGSTQASTINFQIRGQNPATTINFQCQGLDGCVTKLQALSKNLEKEKNRVTQFKSDYIMRSNQQIEAATKRFADTMAASNSQIFDQINQLSARLTALGVKGSIKAGRVSGIPLERDDDGLIKAPSDVLAAVSSFMNPGIVDLDDGTFADSQSGIQERIAELDEKGSEISAMQNQMAGLLETCKQEDIDKLVEKFDKVKANAESCFHDENFCSKDSASEVAELFRSLQGVDGLDLESESLSIDGALSAGRNCERHAALGNDREYEALKETKKRLKDCWYKFPKEDDPNFKVPTCAGSEMAECTNQDCAKQKFDSASTAVDDYKKSKTSGVGASTSGVSCSSVASNIEKFKKDVDALKDKYEGGGKAIKAAGENRR